MSEKLVRRVNMGNEESPALEIVQLLSSNGKFSVIYYIILSSTVSPYLSYKMLYLGISDFKMSEISSYEIYK